MKGVEYNVDLEVDRIFKYGYYLSLLIDIEMDIYENINEIYIK